MRLSFPALLTRSDAQVFSGATGPLASLLSKIGERLPNIFNGALSLYMSKTTGTCFPRLDRAVVNLLGYSRKDPALAVVVGVTTTVASVFAARKVLNSARVQDFKEQLSEKASNVRVWVSDKAHAIHNRLRPSAAQNNDGQGAGAAGAV